MRTEHRHELKTNELAQWLANLPDWAKQNQRAIIYASIFAVVLVIYAIWYNYQKNVVSASQQNELARLIAQLPQSKGSILQRQRQEGGTDMSYMLIQQTANEFQTLAANTKNNGAAATALIKQGEVLRTELHYRLGKIEPQDLTGQINQAKECYTAAIEKSSGIPSLAVTAKFGLGLCEEELFNFDKAKELYEQITAEPNFAGTTGRAAAKQRLAVMDSYKNDVVFKPSPFKPAPEAVQPQVLPGASEDVAVLQPMLAESNAPASQGQTQSPDTTLPGE
jgi:tetratricopeptide (TPR) repeat protein